MGGSKECPSGATARPFISAGFFSLNQNPEQKYNRYRIQKKIMPKMWKMFFIPSTMTKRIKQSTVKLSPERRQIGRRFGMNNDYKWSFVHQIRRHNSPRKGGLIRVEIVCASMRASCRHPDNEKSCHIVSFLWETGHPLFQGLVPPMPVPLSR